MRSIRARRSGIVSGLITRFAPSLTGYLHLARALSALTAYCVAEGRDGRFLLRIEDIDPERCRPEYEWAIYEDLAWLGLEWELPVRLQSEHMAEYAGALERLKVMGVVYPCFAPGNSSRTWCRTKLYTPASAANFRARRRKIVWRVATIRAGGWMPPKQRP